MANLLPVRPGRVYTGLPTQRPEGVVCASWSCVVSRQLIGCRLQQPEAKVHGEAVGDIKLACVRATTGVWGFT